MYIVYKVQEHKNSSEHIKKAVYVPAFYLFTELSAFKIHFGRTLACNLARYSLSLWSLVRILRVEIFFFLSF